MELNTEGSQFMFFLAEKSLLKLLRRVESGTPPEEVLSDLLITASYWGEIRDAK